MRHRARTRPLYDALTRGGARATALLRNTVFGATLPPTTTLSLAVAGLVAGSGCARTLDGGEREPRTGVLLEGAPTEPSCELTLAERPRFELDLGGLPWDPFFTDAVDEDGALVSASLLSPTRLSVYRVTPEGAVEGPWEMPLATRFEPATPVLVAPLRTDGRPAEPGLRHLFLCGPNGLARIAISLPPGDARVENLGGEACGALYGFSFLDDEVVVVWSSVSDAADVSDLRWNGVVRPTEGRRGAIPLRVLDSLVPLMDGGAWAIRRVGAGAFVGERYPLVGGGPERFFRVDDVVGARFGGFFDPARATTWLVWEVFRDAAFDVDVLLGQRSGRGSRVEPVEVERGAARGNDFTRVAVVGDGLFRAVHYAPVRPTALGEVALSRAPLDRPAEAQPWWSILAADLPELYTDGRTGLWLTWSAAGNRTVAFFPATSRCDP